MLYNLNFKGFKTTNTYVGRSGAIVYAINVEDLTVEDILDESDNFYGGGFLAVGATGGYTTARYENIFVKNNRATIKGQISIGFTKNGHMVGNIIPKSENVSAYNNNRSNQFIYIINNYSANSANYSLRLHGSNYCYVFGNTLVGSQAGIWGDGTSPAIIENNTIYSALAPHGYDAGIWINPQSAEKWKIRNNRIYNCKIGIYTLHYSYGFSGYQSSAEIVNNVIYGGSGDGIKMDSPYIALDIRNNIIVNNNGYGISATTTTELPTTIKYNDIWNNALGSYNGTTAGTGDISADPLFANASTGDFHLQSQAGRWNGTDWVLDSQTSPAIDAGDPTSDYSLEPASNGSRINLGAYGNTAEASKSYSGVDTTPPTISTTDPTNNATDVSPSKTITVAFSETIQSSTNYANITLKDSSNNSVSISKSISGNVLTIDPASDLDYGKTYTITIPASAVKDSSNNDLAAQYTFSFTTSAQPVLTTISVFSTSTSTTVGGTKTFTAIPKDQFGNTMTGITIAWTSSNTGVATINSSSGVATGISAGNTTITATSGGISGTAALTITSASASAGLVGYWKFDETSGTTAYDSSGNNNNGTLTNRPVWTTGKVGNALQFDGVDDYVSITNSSGLDITSAITIESWVKPITSQWKFIYGRGDSFGGFAGVMFSIYSNNKVRFVLGNGTNIDTLDSTDTLILSQWTHVVATWDGTTKIIYINGKQNGLANWSGPIVYSGSNIIIGRRTGGSQYYFSGSLDEVRIYSRALSASEVLAEYNAASQTTDTTLPTISISSPTNNQSFTNPSITVTGTASDNIALSKVEVKLNSGSYQTATGTTNWSIPLTLVSGSNTITAKATDSSNNTKETSITVTYTPPNTAPAAPQTLINTSGDASVVLSWLAPSSNGGSAITSYKVYRGTSSGGETLLSSGGCSSLGNVLTCADAAVANGTTYYYQATAVNSIGESPKSNETIANPQATRIQGTVSNSSSAPIQGATITDGTRIATTDASGNYTINTAAGTYTLTASKSGYVSSSKPNITVNTAQTATVNFTLYETDAIPPNLSAGSPSGTLLYNTTQANLTLTTDESATCKYSTSQGISYASMSSAFTTTGTTAHSQPITGLTSGQSYAYYVRCQDGSNNANSADYKISFSIASAPSGGGGGGGASTPDKIPPSKVTELTSISTETEILIAWKNPTDGDYDKTKIVRKENSYPTSHTDGTAVFNDNKTSYTDKSLKSGTTYYYSVFTYDASNNYSSAYQFTAVTKGTSQGGSTSYPDETLLKTPESFKVYVIISQKKKWIPTPEVFETLGYKWGSIAAITKETLNAIPDYEDNLIRAINDYKVYLVVNGIKRHIPNPEIFLDYGFSWDDVKDVPAETINKYSRGYLIRESRQGDIFYLSPNGIKKWIPNPEIFSSYNNKWEDIQVVSKLEMESYPVSNLRRYNNQIFLIENNVKRLIPNEDVLKRYDASLILDVNKNEFEWYKARNQVR